MHREQLIALCGDQRVEAGGPKKFMREPPQILSGRIYIVELPFACFAIGCDRWAIFSPFGILSAAHFFEKDISCEQGNPRRQKRKRTLTATRKL